MSFSIRDEEGNKVVLRIAKPHCPVQVLRTFFGKDLSSNHLWLIQCKSELNSVKYHGYIGLCNRNEENWIFLNHRLIYCPLILKLIKTAFKERIDLSSNLQDLHDKHMFVIFFFILSPREFTFFNKDGKRHVMFYDMQKILNNIKNCTFKCLAEETTIFAAALSDLRETRPLTQMQLNSKDSISNSKINEYNKNVISLKENKVVAFNLKRKRITSTIVTNKRHNKETSNMKIVNFAEGNIVLNSQVDIASTKHTNNLCEGKITKKIYSNVDGTSATFTNLAATNNFVESRETCNDHDGKDFGKDFAISPLSEWSDWNYDTSDKDKVSKKDINFQRLLNCTDRFNFLPRKLHGLLRHRHVKLTNVKRFDSPSNTISRK